MNNNDRFQFRAWDTVACRYEYEIQYSLFDYYIDDDRYVIEQCTGLKDKSGRLIYEGDIISGEDLTDIYDGIVGVAEVRWNDESAEYGVYLVGGDYLTFDDVGDLVEIIGNIHENPELLEAENNGTVD